MGMCPIVEDFAADLYKSATGREPNYLDNRHLLSVVAGNVLYRRMLAYHIQTSYFWVGDVCSYYLFQKNGEGLTDDEKAELNHWNAAYNQLFNACRALYVESICDVGELVQLYTDMQTEVKRLNVLINASKLSFDKTRTSSACKNYGLNIAVYINDILKALLAKTE